MYSIHPHVSLQTKDLLVPLLVIYQGKFCDTQQQLLCYALEMTEHLHLYKHNYKITHKQTKLPSGIFGKLTMTPADEEHCLGFEMVTGTSPLSCHHLYPFWVS